MAEYEGILVTTIGNQWQDYGFTSVFPLTAYFGPFEARLRFSIYKRDGSNYLAGDKLHTEELPKRVVPGDMDAQERIGQRFLNQYGGSGTKFVVVSSTEWVRDRKKSQHDIPRNVTIVFERVGSRLVPHTPDGKPLESKPATRLCPINWS